MLRTEAFTAGLSERTERWIEEQAREWRRPPHAVLEALAEEAARMRQFPGIAFGGPEASRRAWVMGTGLDVWELVHLFNGVGSIEGLTASWNVTEEQVRRALSYYHAYPEEIDAAIAENVAAGERAEAEYPNIVIDE